MKNIYKITQLAISLALICEFCYAQNCDPQSTRYRTRNFFSSNQVLEDVRYWFRPGGFFSGSRSQNMDIYLPPVSDTENQRPAVVWMHGGGFIGGNKSIDNAALFCSTLARMGYVAVSIDYRKDIVQEVFRFPPAPERAVYKGVQDGRSAIRFLKANAETLGIDVDKIFMAGSSAGAFIALHNAYLNEDERPSNTFGGFFRSNLGCLDCGEGNNDPGNGDTDAILSLWGALGTADYIEPGETVPALFVHGTSDGTVSAFNGKPFTNLLPAFLNPLPNTDGTVIMTDRLESLGSAAPDFETYLFPNEDHSFWSGADVTFDFILTKTIDFFFEQLGNLEPSPSISGAVVAASGLTQTYTVPATPGADYCWEVVRGEIVSSSGNEIVVRWNDPNRAGTVNVIESINGNVRKSSSLIVDISSGNAFTSQPFALRGNQAGQSISLQWQTGADSDYDYFVIERSTDGQWFEAIGEVMTAAGDLRVFDFKDEQPITGKNVYRLRQVDHHGNIAFSNALDVLYANEPVFSIDKAWPNPMTNKLFVDFTAAENANIVVTITDINGRSVLASSVTAERGRNQLSLSSIGLEPGVYVLNLQNGDKNERLKLIK